MGTLHEDQCAFLILPRLILLRMKNISGKRYKENQNTHFTFKKKKCIYIYTLVYIYIYIYFRKSYLLWDNVEKYGRAGEAADDNMAHAHCMLNT